MRRDEATRRDRILRDLFNGKDWDKNEEFMLKRTLVLRSAAILPSYPFLVEDEWDVESGRTDLGRGDLVFTDGEGRFAVVEVKHIDLSRSGDTVRRKRTKSRSQVVQQAVTYANAYQYRDGVAEVTAWTYTNEQPDRALPATASPDSAESDDPPVDAASWFVSVPDEA